MNSEERVTISIEGGVADVRMNRPEKINALDDAQFAAIVDAGASLKKDPAIRAVVLSGNGRGFCAGLDFGNFQQMAGAGRADRTPGEGLPAGVGDLDGRITHLPQQACWVWQELQVPVIAAVHGVALGGGCQLALCADIRIAAPDAQFSVLEIRWGITPDMTATAMLPLLVGLDVAKELTFTGRMVPGKEAERIGLATKGERHATRGRAGDGARDRGQEPAGGSRREEPSQGVAVPRRRRAVRGRAPDDISPPRLAQPDRSGHGLLREARSGLPGLTRCVATAASLVSQSRGGAPRDRRAAALVPGLRFVDPTRPPSLFARAYAAFAATRVARFISRHLNWKLDPFLLRVSRGRLSTTLVFPTAVLETLGARSGVLRRNATIYFHDGDHVTIAASNAGSPRHPAWYHNLRAHPDVNFAGIPMRANVVDDEAEQERLWVLADRVFPAFASYRRDAAKLNRTIPIVQLTQRESDAVR